ncbi:hypothetical protein DAEQUDRAFT_558754 [Daedalea quercina L-15889]|uniref:Uncharacterized protein n=1 Tax=Daedalea quercina L-15889 TaxID=1314783 RepID=A0A165M2P1_9APHY|nr:hypothetical protein DAEQUDRAFT_558754 [Daedalea quercina L-15889]
MALYQPVHYDMNTPVNVRLCHVDELPIPAPYVGEAPRMPSDYSLSVQEGRPNVAVSRARGLSLRREPAGEEAYHPMMPSSTNSMYSAYDQDPLVSYSLTTYPPVPYPPIPYPPEQYPPEPPANRPPAAQYSSPVDMFAPLHYMSLPRIVTEQLQRLAVDNAGGTRSSLTNPTVTIPGVDGIAVTRCCVIG